MLRNFRNFTCRSLCNVFANFLWKGPISTTIIFLSKFWGRSFFAFFFLPCFKSQPSVDFKESAYFSPGSFRTDLETNISMGCWFLRRKQTPLRFKCNELLTNFSDCERRCQLWHLLKIENSELVELSYRDLKCFLHNLY